jgi:menaquinol-cytochrome c reductase iron-sulfur subunit
MSVTRRLVSREGFLGLFIFSVGGLAGIAVGIPIIGFVLAPLIQGEKNVWRDVGPVDKFKPGTTQKVVFTYPEESNSSWAGSTQYTTAWLRRVSGDNFVAFASYCTHLGCPVQWLSTPRIFLCPCHGSVFNADGSVAGGPAPRPLFTYQTRVVNGRVQIKTEAQPTVGFTTA